MYAGFIIIVSKAYLTYGGSDYWNNITSNTLIIDDLNLNLDLVISKIKDVSKINNYNSYFTYILNSCDLNNSIISYKNNKYLLDGLISIKYNNHLSLSINNLFIDNNKSTINYFLNQASITYVNDNLMIDNFNVDVNTLNFYLERNKFFQRIT